MADNDLGYPRARVAKAMTLEQGQAFWQALQKANVDQPTALEQMFKQFVESQGVEWPERQPRGGKREGAGAKWMKAQRKRRDDHAQ